MTDTDANPPAMTERDDLRTVGRLVDQRIRRWQRDLLWGGPSAQAASLATLARLRRGAGKPAGSVPDILPFTLGSELTWPGASDAATDGEIAAHLALTLYALHQQSRTVAMHRRGHRFGASMRRLVAGEPTIPPDPVTRRFQVVLTADSLDELTHHTRGAIQLLRSAPAGAIPLDYGLFADELVWWQKPTGQGDVRRRWAREFYRQRTSPKPSSTDSPSGELDDATEPEGNN